MRFWYVVLAAAAVAAQISTASAQSADSKPGAVFRDCPDCPEMVVIPAGSGIMGTSAEEDLREYGDASHSEIQRPVHTVTLAHPIAVGKFEITKGEYAAFARATNRVDPEKCVALGPDNKPAARPGFNWSNPGFAQGDREPAVCVSWESARAFAAWLSQKTGKNYRLLSESEWEYAARGGTKTARWWGDSREETCRHANVTDVTTPDRDIVAKDPKDAFPCSDGQGRTAPVGSYDANPFGLFDVIGNVWEWTEDCFVEGYKGAPSDGSARMDGDCKLHPVRGGGWHVNPRDGRAAYRGTGAPGHSSYILGFRIARGL